MSNERLEIILMWAFGFTLLFVYAFIAHGIGKGQVEEKTSYGLPTILDSLRGLGVAWGLIIVSRWKDRKASANGKEDQK